MFYTFLLLWWTVWRGWEVWWSGENEKCVFVCCLKKTLKLIAEIPRKILIVLDTSFDLGNGESHVITSQVKMRSACLKHFMRQSTDERDIAPLPFVLRAGLFLRRTWQWDVRGRRRGHIDQPTTEKYQDLSSLGVNIDPNLTSINIYFSGQ